MKKIFIQQSLQDEINEKGFLILNILDKNTVQNLTQLYTETIQNKIKHDLYESSRNNDKNTNNQIVTIIHDILKPIFNKLCENINFYGGTFMVKSNNKSTELPLHQDWNIVNENKNCVYFIWAPIQDTNKKNGTLFLIEKSHHLYKNIRSGSFPSNRISRHLIPNKFITTVDLKLGEILIYNPALFHGSYKNKEQTERVIATAMITDKDAPLVYYHKKDETKIDCYQLSANSYLNDITFIANGIVPKGAVLIDTLTNQVTTIQNEMLLKKLNIQYGIKEKIIRNIKAIIKK